MFYFSEIDRAMQATLSEIGLPGPAGAASDAECVWVLFEIVGLCCQNASSLFALCVAICVFVGN